MNDENYYFSCEKNEHRYGQYALAGFNIRLTPARDGREYSGWLKLDKDVLPFIVHFDEYNADFSKLGTSEGRNIYIGSVTHKTFISVGEKGTKAGAATVVEMSDTQAEPPTDIKEVNLDRPFVYMIVDCENNIPLFIGTMMNVNN